MRGRRGDRGSLIGRGLFPVCSEENDRSVREHPHDVAPTGSADRSADGKKVGDVSESGVRKSQRQHQTQRAEPQGQSDARAQNKPNGKEEIAGCMKNEDLAEYGVLLKPTGRREKEVQVGGDGNDGDLKEIQYAGPINAGRCVVGGGQKQQKDRGRPDEKEDVGGPGQLSGTGDKALVVSRYRLCR